MLVYSRISFICLICSVFTSNANLVPSEYNILGPADTAHEGVPLGVPISYDWSRSARIGWGLDNKGFKAITGWGQVYSTSQSPSIISIELRKFRSYILSCELNSWELIQQGDISGRAFRPDYKDNESQYSIIHNSNNIQVVNFNKGLVFHFWPQIGQVKIPNGVICGFFSAVQARMAGKQDNDRKSSALIGLGGDYWKFKGAEWDNYRTNADIGIGQLREIHDEWRWYGFAVFPENVNDLIYDDLDYDE